MISLIICIFCGLAVIGADQLTKYIVMSEFYLGETREFINGFIDFTYIHNRGAAWGMLSGKTWILLAFTVAVMIFCVAVLIKQGIKNKLLLWAMTLVLSGGIGNLIDRVFRDGNVIDFLHFEFWPTFPVFNIADCAIVVGAGMLILYFVLDTVNEYKQKSALAEEQAENGED